MKTLRQILAILAIMLWVGLVYADIETTTVTFVIPSSTEHSVAYGGSCSSSNFYFVENDTTKDGSQTMINATADTGATSSCQDGSTSAITVSNAGSSIINVSANFTVALPSGITVKAANATAGYESSCSGTVTATTCADIPNGASVILAKNMAAQTGTADIWIWVDMSSFNSGVATSGIARTMQTHGTVE